MRFKYWCSISWQVIVMNSVCWHHQRKFCIMSGKHSYNSNRRTHLHHAEQICRLNILFQRVLHRTLKFCCAMPSCSSLGTEIPKTASSCTELFSGVTIELFYDILMKMLVAKTDISCQPRTVTEKVHFLRIWHIPKGLNIFRNCYHLCLN